jgi:hypothetical protein
MKAIIIAALLLTACGTEPTATDPSTPAETDKAKAIPSQHDVPSEARYAILVDADLPVCDESRAGALVYQRSTKTFFTCEEAEWLAIDIKGDPGKDGAPGKDATPIAGTNGEDGTDGKPGRDGTDGQNAPAYNSWVDPVTGFVWIFGASSVSHSVAEAACTGDYELPSPELAIDAVSHGILIASAAISGPTTMWDNMAPALPSPNDWHTYVDSSATQKTAAFPGTQGVICVHIVDAP